MKTLIKKIWTAILALLLFLSMVMSSFGVDKARPPGRIRTQRREEKLEN